MVSGDDYEGNEIYVHAGGVSRVSGYYFFPSVRVK